MMTDSVNFDDQIAGIRSVLPLLSAGEVAAQLLVYMLVED